MWHTFATIYSFIPNRMKRMFWNIEHHGLPLYFKQYEHFLKVVLEYHSNEWKWPSSVCFSALSLAVLCPPFSYIIRIEVISFCKLPPFPGGCLCFFLCVKAIHCVCCDLKSLDIFNNNSMILHGHICMKAEGRVKWHCILFSRSYNPCVEIHPHHVISVYFIHPSCMSCVRACVCVCGGG